LARALIVGCGCRGAGLARSLLAAGWQVRGTTRGTRLDEIEAAGADPVTADPDRLATLLEHVGDVAVVFWLLASAEGGADKVRALHDERLASFLRELVDTPVRGFVYERAGTAAEPELARGEEIVRGAAARWRLPVELVSAPPGRPQDWLAAMTGAAGRLAGPL
jgi:nucleoside-diphosphate-sugar epimerase